jgi:hypothetical protein
MLLLVFGFLSILLITFALVAAMTRKSPIEKTINRRMAKIQTIRGPENGIAPQTAQLLKATRTGGFGWFEGLLERYQFSQRLQKRILQGHNYKTVETLLLGSFALFIHLYEVA